MFSPGRGGAEHSFQSAARRRDKFIEQLAQTYMEDQRNAGESSADHEQPFPLQPPASTEASERSTHSLRPERSTHSHRPSASSPHVLRPKGTAASLISMEGSSVRNRRRSLGPTTTVHSEQTVAALKRSAEMEKRMKEEEAEKHGLVGGVVHGGVELASAGVGKATGVLTGAAIVGVDAAVGIMDVGIGAVNEVTHELEHLLLKNPLVHGLQAHVLPAFAPVAAPVLTPVRKALERARHFEARHHGTFQAVPHSAPMAAAVLCIILMMLPIMDSTATPWLFQWSITLTLLGLVGWLLVELGNDYMHFQYGLLRPQRPRTVLYVFVVGTIFLALRITHLSVDAPPEEKMSTEFLQRSIMGIPYFIFRFFGLDMWGWTIGFLAFSLFVSFGFLALCMCNCCGRVRGVQKIFRRRRDAMPFMDMVSNKFTLFSYNALLFLFPFCVMSTFVIGGSVLMEPSRSFAPAGPPISIKLLCSPIVTKSFYEMASNGVEQLGELGVARGILPPSLGTSDHARAIATVLLDLTWRNAFEPIESECDSMLVSPLKVDAARVGVPRLAVTMRDSNGLVAGLSEDAIVYVQLNRQPSNVSVPIGAFADVPGGATTNTDWLYSSLTPRRPWCVNGGCGGTPEVGCSTDARLEGTVLSAAGRAAARAGVIVFDELKLVAEGNAKLCSGDYELKVTLHQFYEDSAAWAEGEEYSGWRAGVNTSTPPYEAFPPPTLETLVNVRLVRALNYTDVDVISWSVELPGVKTSRHPLRLLSLFGPHSPPRSSPRVASHPSLPPSLPTCTPSRPPLAAFYNVSEMTRTSARVTYRQEVHLRDVFTEVTTNTTTVGFEWVDNATATALSTDPAGTTVVGTSFGLDASNTPTGKVPAWPRGDFEPIHSALYEKNRRPVAHIISFIKPPPTEAVLLRKPFEVSLRVTTEVGLALAGEQVQALLLAPLGSGLGSREARTATQTKLASPRST